MTIFLSNRANAIRLYSNPCLIQEKTLVINDGVIDIFCSNGYLYALH